MIYRDLSKSKSWTPYRPPHAVAGHMPCGAAVLAVLELRRVVTETFGWAVSAPANTTSPGVGNGDYSPGMDPGWLASMMVAIVQGGCVLAHAQQDPVVFDAMVVGR